MFHRKRFTVLVLQIYGPNSHILIETPGTLHQNKKGKLQFDLKGGIATEVHLE